LEGLRRQGRSLVWETQNKEQRIKNNSRVLGSWFSGSWFLVLGSIFVFVDSFPFLKTAMLLVGGRIDGATLTM
jgi:hypothetical protein